MFFIQSAAEAERLALRNFSENSWSVVTLEEEPMLVSREDYLEDPEWLEWYDQADENGECYIFHQWPPEPQEDDAIH